MVRGRGLLAGLLFAGLMVAGCTHRPGAPAAAPPGPAASDAASVEGLVLDVEGMPIAAADVFISTLALATQTDAGGLFVLSPVPPGVHRVEAAALGYRTAERTVRVAAGPVHAGEFALVPLPSERPYAVTASKAGIFGCGLGWRPTYYFSGIAVCGFLADLPLDTSQVDRFLVPWTVEGPIPGWQGGVFEMEWMSSQALGHGLTFRFDVEGCSDGRDGSLGSASGRSPLRIEDDVQAVRSAAAAPCVRHCEEETCALVSRVFATPDTLGPQAPVDAGASFEQAFHQYTTTFFHAPPVPEFSALAA